MELFLDSRLKPIAVLRTFAFADIRFVRNNDHCFVNIQSRFQNLRILIGRPDHTVDNKQNDVGAIDRILRFEGRDNLDVFLTLRRAAMQIAPTSKGEWYSNDGKGMAGLARSDRAE